MSSSVDASAAVAASYTPLESLFLVQSVLNLGVDAAAFVRISETLTSNTLIKAGDTYDAARLRPDALQQLYLQLLREELRGDSDSNTNHDDYDDDNDQGAADRVVEGDAQKKQRQQAGAVSSGKKRKAPLISTLNEACRYAGRVPALLERLYARYRDYIVTQIRADESKIAMVQKEIQVLEKSESQRLARSASQSAGAPVITPRDARNAAKGSSGSPSPSSPGPPALGGGVAAGVPGARRGSAVSASARAHPHPPPPPHGSGASSPSQMGVYSPHLQPGGVPPPSNRPSPSPKPPNGVRGTAHAGLPHQQLLQQAKPGTPAQPARGSRPGLSHTNADWEKQYPPPHAAVAPFGQHPVQASQTPMQQAQDAATQVQPHSVPFPPNFGPANTTHHYPTGQGMPQQYPQNHQQPLYPQQPSYPQQPPHPQHRPIAVSQANVHGRPIQPHSTQPVRPLAVMSPHPGPGAHYIPLKLAPTQPANVQPTSPSRTQSPAQRDKSPYNNTPRLAIPEHMIRQAINTPQKRASVGSLPHTPLQTSPMPLTRGFGTKWASKSTPSTPGPILEEPESPAFEPVSPPVHSGSITRGSSRSVSVKGTPLKSEATAARSRSSRTSNRGRAVSSTPSAAGTRRSQSILSQADESLVDFRTSTRVKKEASTPRLREETGDTTADESAQRRHRADPGGAGRGHKRKRQGSPPPRGPPPTPPTHVLWTRGFTKVSSSALDQISSHRDANMFATALRERDAPNYRQIVLHPQDITSIRAAIKHGNKAALQSAASLPGGDPGGASVWLPISADLTPPRSIVNSAQLERELVHMFCNAIMYNPDPDRGPGRVFMQRLRDDEEKAVGYRVDEDGVVRNTRGMFLEVEKLLTDLRSAERDRAPPPPAAADDAAAAAGGGGGAVAQVATPRESIASAVAAPAEDTTGGEEDDGDGAGSVSKRRRVSARS